MNAFSIPQNRELTLRKFGDPKLLIIADAKPGAEGPPRTGMEGLTAAGRGRFPFQRARAGRSPEGTRA